MVNRDGARKVYTEPLVSLARRTTHDHFLWSALDSFVRHHTSFVDMNNRIT